MAGHRKTVRHFHEPGDLHELTFSCYRRQPLLTNDLWRQLYCQAADRAVACHPFRLVAFVMMPERPSAGVPHAGAIDVVVDWSP
jgi:putative transposase